MQIKKFPKVAVVATKLNFLQYKYRFRINHKTLYSQTFPGPHFCSWIIAFQFVFTSWKYVSLLVLLLRVNHLVSEFENVVCNIANIFPVSMY